MIYETEQVFLFFLLLDYITDAAAVSHLQNPELRSKAVSVLNGVFSYCLCVKREVLTALLCLVSEQ